MLTRLNPLKGDDIMSNVFDTMDKIWNTSSKLSIPKSDWAWTSVYERGSPVRRRIQGNETRLEFEVPGFSKEDLKIEYADGEIYVFGEKGDRRLEFREKFGSVIDPRDCADNLPISAQSYKKILQDTISAKCENGILTIAAELEKPEKRGRKNVREITIT